jgi:Plasmid encoded RepA protein
MVTKVETRIEAEAQFTDCGQLVPQLTLHDVLVQRGEAGATYALGRTERVRGRRATSDVLTGRRGRRIIKAAKEHLDDKTRAAAEEARAFVYSAWCHASFPHKPPASVEETWTVQTDYVSLRVDPGKRTTDTGEYSIGLPYGAYARLLCIDWSSQAYNNRSRDIELGKNLGDTMKRLGLNTGGGKTRERLLEQAERLVRCRLTFDIRGKGKSALINQTIVDTAVFNESARNSRFVERIRLSETFYQQLLQYPVAIDPLSIMAIRNSPMAIDVYCWLAYRLLAVTEPTSISWTGAQGSIRSRRGRHAKLQVSVCGKPAISQGRLFRSPGRFDRTWHHFAPLPSSDHPGETCARPPGSGGAALTYTQIGRSEARIVRLCVSLFVGPSPRRHRGFGPRRKGSLCHHVVWHTVLMTRWP